MRLRGEQAWGRRDVRGAEADHLKLANKLMVNFLTACEGVSLRGGSHLLEHPADPEEGEEPPPSISHHCDHALVRGPSPPG